MRLFVLAPALGERHDLDAFALGEPMDLGHESVAHRRHQRRRGDHRPTVVLEEADHTAAGLQPWLIGIEIEPINALDIQLHLVPKQLPYRVFYHCYWPRLTLGLRVLSPLRRLPPESSDSVSINRGHPRTRWSEAKPR